MKYLVAQSISLVFSVIHFAFVINAVPFAGGPIDINAFQNCCKCKPSGNLECLLGAVSS